MSDAPFTPSPAPLNSEPSARKGLLDPKAVRLASFWIIAICLLASTAICILAIWDFTGGEQVWRAFATFVVVATATWIFSIINERFGE